MAKRIYWSKVNRIAQENKKYLIPGVIGTSLIFFLLMAIGGENLTIHSFSFSKECAGTPDNPCILEVNFTPKEDIFIYPINHRNPDLFEFNPDFRDFKLKRSWGKGWREIPLDKPCSGTWCGLSNNKDTRKFSICFREGKNYIIRMYVYKNNPKDIIKWKMFDQEGIWNAQAKTGCFQVGLDQLVCLTERDGYWDKAINYRHIKGCDSGEDCVIYNITSGEIIKKQGKDVFNNQVI